KGVASSHKFINKLMSMPKNASNADSYKIKTKRDKIIISKLNLTIKESEIHLENYEFNFAINKSMMLINYLAKFEDELSKDVFSYAFKRCVLMLSPFIPHTCEEIWEKMKNKKLISQEAWPRFDNSLINERLEAMEKIAENLISDIQGIIELTQKKPKNIKIFASSSWKYFLCDLIRKEGIANPKELIKKAMKDEKLKIHGKEAISIISAMAKDLSKLISVKISQKEEIEMLEMNKNRIEKEFSAKIEIIKAEESNEIKAKTALPGKPGILIE
ncbi:MAG: class I tRNA ligase family protein, partial [Candidatus Nanoarchaeia archaeon]|nr:class I tRNA ligase family protein [Candidatus Nanoarchaeia archaeon]